MTEETTTEQLAEIQGQPEPVQVREGRWRTRRGDIRNVTPTPAHDSRAKRWPWWDAKHDQTWREDGGHHIIGESSWDLVQYLGPIEPEPQPEPQAAAIEELRSEVSYVQRLLGESNRKVAQLEELVTSLRTINEGAEKAVSGAGVVNDSLRLQLAAVKAELASVAADRQRLRVELDAAQQVPADSPELRQLRADLEQVTLGRDTYRDGYERVLSDLKTISETTKAETVEVILEWLEPVRATIEAADNVQQTMRADNLACDIIRNLPGILRYVVGLNHPEEIE